MQDSQFVCGVDIGGTFTDCVLIDGTGDVTVAKTVSTHDEGLESGFFDCINAAAEKIGYEEDEIFDDIVRLAHGSTIATNAVVEEEGVKTGLLTTNGHQDTVIMMRGLGRPTGEPPERRTNIFIGKPDPIVPRELTRGIPERVDAHGEIIVSLDEQAVRTAVRELIAEGVEAVAVSLLWSFKNPEHERRVAEIIKDEAPDLFVSCSHETSPSLGEYERSVATCINSLVGPETSAYLDTITESLREDKQYGGPFYIMQANGGTGTAEMAAQKPISLIGSGPAGGVRACEELVVELDTPDVIVTDMGGTSFEVGVIADGEPLVNSEPVVKNYQYNLPKLDIKSIGAGGGSVARVDEDSGGLRVGPKSAGAEPGPACYGLGGADPTVTDADLVLGYIDPDAEFGGQVSNHEQLAREALEPLADRLGLSLYEAAKGIFDVTNAKMANLAQQEVIGRGYDPRDFTVVSYGGAGPIHAAAYADELGSSTVVVPSEVSPVWSAYGISQSDVTYTLEREVVMLEPFDPAELRTTFEDLESEGLELLRDAGIPAEDIAFNRSAKMQYEGQLNQLNISVSKAELGEGNIEQLLERFQREYSQRYSPAAQLPEARTEIVSIRLNPVGRVQKSGRVVTTEKTDTIPNRAKKPSRAVYMGEQDGTVEVDVYRGTELRPGNEIAGPTVIDLPNTSIVVHSGQTVSINEYHDFEISL